MKVRGEWLPWVSRRFLTGRRGGRGRLVFIFAVVLISSGVATLNTILAVMNGLQQGYIRSILEIGSYHLRWSPDDTSRPDEIAGILDAVGSDSSVSLIVPFREGQTMLNGLRPRPFGALIRGVPESLYLDDEGLADNLQISSGEFDLSGRGIVLGEDLALDLGVSPGDTVTALDLGSAGFDTEEQTLVVTGLFSCDYADYEAALGFVSLDTSVSFFGDSTPEIGIKLKNLDRDQRALNRLRPVFAENGGNLESWRVTNRSFFGALRTEKMAMLLLLGLIFVVVAVNIDHSLRRMATERVEDLSILKALGASPLDIRLLFLRYGLVIGGAGGLVGSFLGILIGANVAGIIGFFYHIRSFVAGFFGFGSPGFNSLGAFLRSSEVMAGDVIIVFALAIVLSTLSAFRAAGMAARLKPAEVLRSE